MELDYSTPEVRVGSAMERAGFDPKKAWHIYLMIKGQPKQEVSVDYIVDLRTPGTLRLEDVLRAETVLVLRPALDELAARATVGSAE